MASNYPGSLDTFDTIASDKKTSDSVGGRTHRQMHNDLGDAVEAVQAELGTDPAGASATVKARFEAIEASGWVTSARILDGTIVNADINSAAAIDRTKLAQPAYSAKTSAYTATSADDVLNVTSGTFTLDLPAANTCAGKTLKVKNSGTGVVTLDGNSSETVEGVATFPLGPGSYVEVTSTGSAWILTGGTPDTGWRDVSASLINGWASTTYGSLSIRRVGNTVSVQGVYLDGSAKSAQALYAVPSGFRPQSAKLYQRLIFAAQTNAQAYQSALYDFEIDNISSNSTATDLSFIGTFFTSNSWPTSLPGTAV